VVTELIDIAEVPLPVDGAGGDIKDPGFSEKMKRADGLVIVSPEYNHSFPGLLKHVLDTCLEEYIHKAAAVVGVSAGPFGGARGIQNLLPVLRELGLVATFTDLYFSNVGKAFDAQGKLLEETAWSERAANFLDELIWMSTVLRYGRENVSN
jgi:NAD(P)H-dependent FMN reductase